MNETVDGCRSPSSTEKKSPEKDPGPRRVSHLKVFAISLLILAAALIGLLFGVDLEAVAPATGTVTARDLQDVRAALPGLVDPGWFVGAIDRPDSEAIAVRMDDQGDGLSDPASPGPHAVYHHEWSSNGGRQTVRKVGFHRLKPGDELWPGQVIATIRADELRMNLGQIEDRLKELESRGEHSLALRRERDRLRERLGQSVLHVPATGQRWLVVNVPVSPQQAVQPGDVIATIVPIDPVTRHPLDLMVRLDVAERYGADLQPGQPVRLQSNVYNHRLFGSADGRIEQLEPAADSAHHLHAEAAITAAPFRMPLGSSVQAEIVVGKKPVYRIILEH